MSDPITPGAPAPGASGTRPAAHWLRQGDTTDMLKALFLGLVTTAIFYEVYPVPFMEPGRLLGVFDNWASRLIFLMSAWCGFLLLLKLLRHRWQARVQQAILSPASAQALEQALAEPHAGIAIAAFAEHLKARKIKRPEGALPFLRLAAALRAGGSYRDQEGLIALLESESEIEIRRLEASFTILQVFIWAIPILGFIGTVHGIGSAVSEFSEFIRTAEGGGGLSAQMRTALAGVTGGLALAFNTTFLALVVVIPVMLLTSLMQKAEEELLLAIEAFSLDWLVPHVRLAPSAVQTVQDYEEQLQRVMELSARWASQMDPAMAEFARQSELLSHQMAGIQPLVKEFTDRMLGAAAPGPGTPSRPFPRDSD